MATEKRLIDARYLTSQMYSICEVCQTENIFIDAIIDEIDNAPDVDAVEVVRCKGCKYFVQGEPYDPCECMKWMVKFGVAYTTPPGWLLPQGGKERQWVKNHGLCDC